MWTGLKYLNGFLLAVLVILVLLLIFAPPVKAQDLVVGDSIALGTGRALGWPTFAREREGSCWIYKHMPKGLRYNHAVVSAGINDPPGRCFEAIIHAIQASEIVIILPAPINSARRHIAEVASRYNLRTISYACAGKCSTSNFHPASYDVVAMAILGVDHATHTTNKRRRKRRHL